MNAKEKRLWYSWMWGSRFEQKDFTSARADKFIERLQSSMTTLYEEEKQFPISYFDDHTVANMREFMVENLTVINTGRWSKLDARIDRAFISVYIGTCRIFNIDPNACSHANKLIPILDERIAYYTTEKPEIVEVLKNARAWYVSVIERLPDLFRNHFSDDVVDKKAMTIILNDIDCVYSTIQFLSTSQRWNPELNFAQVGIFGDHLISIILLLVEQNKIQIQKKHEHIQHEMELKARARFDKPADPRTSPFAKLHTKDIQ